MTVASTCKRRAKQIKSCNAQLAGDRRRPIYKALLRVHNRDTLTPATRRAMLRAPETPYASV